MEKQQKLNFRVYPYYQGNDDVSCDGSPYEHDWQLDEDGTPYIAGEINVDEMIQSYAKECDINVIVAQHLALGTIGSLSVDPDNTKFVDVSNIPDDLNTLNAMRNKAYATYMNLNAEQKALFTGFEDFMLNTDRLFKKQVKEEVNNNES